MAYQFHLYVAGSDRSQVHGTFAAASAAIAASLTSADESWELVRVSDDPGTCGSVLYGAGQPSVGARPNLRHYPPQS